MYTQHLQSHQHLRRGVNRCHATALHSCSLSASNWALRNVASSKSRSGCAAPLVSAQNSLVLQHHCNNSIGRSCRHVARVSGPGYNGPTGDPFADLLSSPIFKNPVILQEFNSMVNQIMSLGQMGNKFPDFDIEGKKIYLSQIPTIPMLIDKRLLSRAQSCFTCHY